MVGSVLEMGCSRPAEPPPASSDKPPVPSAPETPESAPPPSEPAPETPEVPVPPPPPTEPTAGSPWPSKCLLEGIAAHPSEPWLAAACSDGENERGAVLVFDLRAGALRETTLFEEWVGFATTPGQLRWHPDGKRLITNVSTNGLALVDRGKIVGRAFPDETRDTGVGFVWVDDRIFTDTGSLFAIQAGEPRFEFEALGAPAFDVIEWNAQLGAVVGRVGQGIAAFDPLKKKLVYQNGLEAFPKAHQHWSPGGQWCALRQFATHPAPDSVTILDAKDGTSRWTLHPSSARLRELYWGPDGALALTSYRHEIGSGKRHDQRVDVVRGGKIEHTFDLGSRELQASASVADAGTLAWSPSGDGLAMLLDGQQVRLADTRTGETITDFVAPAPAIPEGLPDYYRRGHRPDFGFPGDLAWPVADRVVRLAPHFVAIYSLSGDKLAEFIVPD